MYVRVRARACVCACVCDIPFQMILIDRSLHKGLTCRCTYSNKHIIHTDTIRHSGVLSCHVHDKPYICFKHIQASIYLHAFKKHTHIHAKHKDAYMDKYMNYPQALNVSVRQNMNIIIPNTHQPTIHKQTEADSNIHK